MATDTEQYTGPLNRWDDAYASGMSELDLLVYRSNLLGSDHSITNTGGGNTSAKLVERDPITDELVDVLWVKGSGGDLRTATAASFSSLYQATLLALESKYLSVEERGPKTEIEDHMVSLYPHATFNLNPRPPSIDTPLHAFIPYAHVDHMHPNAVIAIAASRNSERLTREIWGDDVVWVPWQRPGFDLGLRLREVCREHPNAKGALLAGHGIINWAESSKACYELSLELISKADAFIRERSSKLPRFGGKKHSPLDDSSRTSVLSAVVPFLRGHMSAAGKLIATVCCDESIMGFVNANDAPRLAELGTSCPDHFLRTKIKPLYLSWDPAADSIEELKDKLQKALTHYEADYEAYYQTHKSADSPDMRAAFPTVWLIPGVGMIAWGKNKSESRVTAEFYQCAVAVMESAEAIDEYVALPQREAFDIEYWQLEEAKLKRMPPEKPLARDVVVVIGAGDGIGRAIAHRVADAGAHVVCADLRKHAAQRTCDELMERIGAGIGVAGSGHSSCGPALAVQVDITCSQSVSALFRDALFAFGGIDKVIVTAGVFVAPGQSDMTHEQMFDISYAVNVKGGYIVALEADKIWRQQGLSGSLVLTTSVNAVVPKTGSIAYDTSKAAANHLVRELALMLAPLVTVNGLAPATVVNGSAMFPRDRVLASLEKYQVSHEETDTDEVLRQRLADFYAERTLIKRAITPEDQAEAAYVLVSGALQKTTGQIISVDGGLKDAFLR